MKILIVGGGIAGLTLADCLLRSGHFLTIVEKGPELRTEGYMIDFFGPGFEAAEKMGLLNELEKIHYPVESLKFLTPNGKEKSSIPYQSLRNLLQNRHYNFMRGNLERLLYDRIKEHVDFRFGTTVQFITQSSEYVDATLSDGSSFTCDLLVGADGIHSKVRSLTFGKDPSPLHFLGYNTAAFVLDAQKMDKKYRHSFNMLIRPNRQVSVYPISKGRLATFFMYKSPRLEKPITRKTIARELRSHYGDLGWIIPGLLDSVETVPDLYFDEVSQVRMPEWTRGRVTLIGDACSAVSLIAGQGASMAMAGAWVLSSEIEKEPDLSVALQNYERLMQPTIANIQQSGKRFAKWFAPENHLTLWIRELSIRLAVHPLFSRFISLNRAKLPK
ncbi:FAD-dependent oxidoreductase [Salibacterium salarium]|uniref:FAD-dependent oxidoreductase n=1 Tax=Salibacterium salarium TaxID=284579 RepID=A0A428N621_9BACI|nr:FAD-dependent monooxygenase [Salibacterium salarium]RSL33920.1 FAD-dependent oxidoreductase [Salibacterium salarium]